MCKEDVPPKQQEWKTNLAQEDPEPLHIKEEQQELWSQEENRFKDWREISSFHSQMKAEADGQDCGRSEPARNLDLASDDNNSDFSEAETGDSDGVWKETREPQKNTNSQSVKNIICVV